MELERELFAAHEGQPDLATIDRLYADDFFSTNADGRVVDKAGWLDILRSGRFAVDEIRITDAKVRRYGSVAVVTGRSTYVSGGRIAWDVRHTQVWADIGGQWRLTTWHGTLTSSNE
jgi:hypothetical protein